MNLKEWDEVTRNGRQLLADEIGCSLMTVCNLITGKYQPSLKQCVAIYKVTGIICNADNVELINDIKACLEIGCLGITLTSDDINKESKAIIVENQTLKEIIESQSKEISDLGSKLKDSKGRISAINKANKELKATIKELEEI